MIENMAGSVGFAMHEDRLAKAAKNMRLAEAKRGRQGSPVGARARCRAGIAAALVMVASRIAPAMALPGGQMQPMTR
jgi:hypothetical protein